MSPPFLRKTDTPQLGSRNRPTAVGQGLLQVPPGADAELGEHLTQVPFDRSGTEEELGADLLVRQAIPVPCRNMAVIQLRPHGNGPRHAPSTVQG